ncbi:hypothetical protein [Nocardioides sp. B-3]|uniref:hypothetical protein n=1 Tax=Nocardioides sp. B-3 TaxID=2895565 RepID=UPI002152BB94|nr:hypothetical protein [Nocardioides sp. B-3]UUZ59681.1 hypothetical protein LP418_00575 [Nocardioides sp. B-3]
MTALGRGSQSAAPGAVGEVVDWVEALSSTGPVQEDALRALHGILLRAARLQVGADAAHPRRGGRGRDRRNRQPGLPTRP